MTTAVTRGGASSPSLDASPLPVNRKSTGVVGRSLAAAERKRADMPLARRASSSDVWVCEFQGGLVKLRLCGGGGGSAAPDAAFWYRRAYQQCFNELLQTRPRAEWVTLPDGSFTAGFTGDELAELERAAGERARLLKAAHGSRRGVVSEFSRKSRKRLLELCARLRDDVRGLFLTLTYRENVRDGVAAKKHLDLMLRWLRYHNSETAIIWRAERQERGAWHFHLLLLGASFIPVAGIRSHWLKVIAGVAPADGSSAGNVDIERIHDRKKAMSYVSKYVAKTSEDGGDAIRLDYVPYSENGSPIGRFWGVVGRDFLPLAAAVVFQVVGSPVAVMQFRRAARRFKSRMVWRSRIQGFTLFVNDVLRWLRLYLAGDDGERLVHYMAGDDVLFAVARSLW